MTSFYSTPRLDGQYTRQGIKAPYTRAYESDSLRARKSVESVLGTDIRPDQKNVKDILISAGAWFETAKTDIHFDTKINGLQQTASHKGIIRTDTGDLLGLHGTGYQDVKIQDIEYILETLSEKMTISNVLTMNKGARLYVTATVDENEVTTGDTIRRQLHLYNSHDGSTALGCFFSDRRMICMNELGVFTGSTASAAISQGQGLKMRHTRNVRNFAHSLVKRIDIENQRFEQSIQDYRLMANTGFKKGDAEKILLKVYGDKIKKDQDYTDLKEYAPIQTLVSTGTGVELCKGATMWRFYNALTEYETHISGTAKKNRKEIKFNSKYHGITKTRINKARETVLEMCAA